MAKRVLKILEEEYSVEDIKGKGRKRDLVDARKIYTRYLRENRLRTFQQIGDALGKTHSNCIHLYEESKWITEHDKKAKYVWGLINKTVDKENPQEKEVLRVISDLFEDIDDVDMYFFVLDKLKTIIKAKKETLCMR